MPSTVEIVGRAPAVDEKVWCVFCSFFVCFLSRFGITKFVITETLWSSVIFKTIMVPLHRGRFLVVHLYLKGYFTHLTLISKISHIDKLMNHEHIPKFSQSVDDGLFFIWRFYCQAMLLISLWSRDQNKQMWRHWCCKRKHVVFVSFLVNNKRICFYLTNKSTCSRRCLWRHPCRK